MGMGAGGTWRFGAFSICVPVGGGFSARFLKAGIGRRLAVPCGAASPPRAPRRPALLPLPSTALGYFGAFTSFPDLLSPPSSPAFPWLSGAALGDVGSAMPGDVGLVTPGDVGSQGHILHPKPLSRGRIPLGNQPGRTGASPRAPPWGCPSSAWHMCERFARRPSSRSLLFLTRLGPVGLNNPKGTGGAGGRAPAARRGCVQVQADLSSRSSPCIPLRAGGSLGAAGGPEGRRDQRGHRAASAGSR